MRTKGFLISLPLLLGLILYFNWSELLWFGTQLTDTPEAYASYVESNPSSEHNEQALACIDELEWRLTESYEGVLGFEYYLDRLPNGPHAAEAREGLRAARLGEALATGTLQALDSHTEVYPNDRKEARVQGLLEQLAWRGLLARDSSESFRAFLDQFPEGQFAQEAQDRLDRIEFTTANQRDDREAWEAYLASDPPEHFLEQARVKLDELHWEVAAETASIQSLRGYLASTDQERHVSESQDLLEVLVWEAAKNQGTRQAIAAYIKEFPAGVYHATAQRSQEDLAWATAVESGKPQALASYLSLYPEGSHVDDVPLVQERLIWARAQERDLLKGYEAYLKRFPNGPNAEECSRVLGGSLVQELQAQGQLSLSIVKAKPAVLTLQLSLGSPELEVSSPVTVDFPIGLVFPALEQGFADLVVVRPTRLRLKPGEPQTLLLNVAMLHALEPGTENQYATVPVLDPLIEGLLSKGEGPRPSSQVLQVALLIAMDDMGFEKLSSLMRLGTKSSPSIVIAQAMDLCRRIGVEVSRQRIWSQRALVRADLPNSKIRQWLSHPESVGDAIRFGSTEQLGKLLEAGANPDLTGNAIDGNLNALGLALSMDRLDLGRQLLSSGANLNAISGESSLLSDAIFQGREEWVAMLLEGGAQLDASGTANGDLMDAVALGNVPIIELLLQAGALLNGVDEFEVPLNRAAAEGQLASVRLLIARNAILDRGIDTALMLAAEGGHVEVLRALIGAGAEIDRVGKWGYTALHKSVERGHLACVELLLSVGSDIDRDAGGFRPIDLASFHSQAVVEYLAKQGAMETIFSTVAMGDVDGIERCLARGESLERWGPGAQRPMHVAIAMRQHESLARLLGHGADMGARTTDGFQALHLATQVSWDPAIRALLEHGADPDDPSFEGTPLLLAVAAGDQPSVKLLLELGADPARKRAEGPGALEMAKDAAKTRPRIFKPIVRLLQQAQSH